MTIVAVVIYDRFDNLKRWIDAWRQCEQGDSEFVIIHNYKNREDYLKYKRYCVDRGIKYVPRENVGYDIGAFQDVCMERLHGFNNNWDKLLWITDDFLPMNKEFVRMYTEPLIRGVGVVCTEISREVKMHIRTSGFCITKETSKRITFPSKRVIDKGECYAFEHRDPNINFLEQIKKMKLQAIQVARNLSYSPLWDTEQWARLKRMDEFEALFYGAQKDGKVTVICPVYNTFPEIISSMINQTYRNWELILVHDGPNTTKLRELILTINDSRINYNEHPIRKGKWGHFYRKHYLNEIKEGRIAPNTTYILITNADNHLVPSFLDTMVKEFEKNKETIGVYCSHMVHSYLSPQQTTFIPAQSTSAPSLTWKNYQWGIIPCKLERGYIDCSGIIMRKEAACEVGWRDIESHSSDWTYISDVINKYGEDKFVKVDGCLLVHN